MPGRGRVSRRGFRLNGCGWVGERCCVWRKVPSHEPHPGVHPPGTAACRRRLPDRALPPHGRRLAARHMPVEAALAPGRGHVQFLRALLVHGPEPPVGESPGAHPGYAKTFRPQRDGTSNRAQRDQLGLATRSPERLDRQQRGSGRRIPTTLAIRRHIHHLVVVAVLELLYRWRPRIIREGIWRHLHARAL